ncbi:MAG TPA: SusC/RagA family TonB-linked outer membrane protein, partial [Pedobacter sp.]
SNQLLPYALPIVTGFGSITNNFPATVKNTSWEFSVNSVNIKQADFNWSTNVNLTIPRNKLLAFPNLATSSYANSLVIGQPITITKVYHALGVDPATGLYTFSSTTDPSNPRYTVDNTAIINTAPKFYAGISNTFSYKRFSLDFLFQYVKQTGLNDFYRMSNPGLFNKNQFVSVLDRWQNPGDQTTFQQFSSTNGSRNQFFAQSTSDAAYADASYLRLKNFSLSWQVTPDWVKSMHLQNLRVYLQGQNLLTFTPYKGLDPETLSVSSLPPLRIITAGIQVGL